MPYNIVMDFETTGINPLQDLPVQVAYAIHDHQGKEIASRSMLLNPERSIHPGAEKIHGISRDRLKTAVKLPEFSEYWHRLIWKFQPCNLLGYNIINFDLIILQRVLGLHKEGKFKYPPIEKIVDVMFLAQRFFKQKKWPRLIEAVNRLSIPHDPDTFHDALVDVRYTWMVYNRLISGR